MTLCETVSPKLENHPLSVVYVREVSLRYRGPRRGVSFDAVGSPVKAAAFMRRVLPDNVREHFLALFLDNRHQVTSYSVLATGTAASCPVGCRELFQAALAAGASFLIVGHNHTSGQNAGELFPSQEDLAVTHRLSAAGDLLGIPVLDHLILGDEGLYSFSEQNQMRPQTP
jgi:DNA repair protein RadC